MPPRFGFGKREKLKSRKLIEELFLTGQSFPLFPLRVTYRFFSSGESGIQVGVTVSKRYFKKAVDRNRIKRLMREAYRLEKHPLNDVVQKRKMKGIIFFMFTDKSITSLEVIRQAMQTSISRLIQKLPEVHEDPS